MLCSLQAQVEFSDSGTLTDANYHAAVSHCMSARLVPNIPLECVAMHHQSLRGMTSDEAKKAFLSLIKSWPLHQATIFDVMVRFSLIFWFSVGYIKNFHFISLLFLLFNSKDCRFNFLNEYTDNVSNKVRDIKCQ